MVGVQENSDNATACRVSQEPNILDSGNIDLSSHADTADVCISSTSQTNSSTSVQNHSNTNICSYNSYKNNPAVANASLTAGGLTTPHYFSPILNTPQSFLRPLMTTQPPLYSPILSAQHHAYPVPHPSPSGSFTSVPDAVRNSFDSSSCPPEMFKEIGLQYRTNSENSSTDKSCSLQSQRQLPTETNNKRSNSHGSCSWSRYASCSEAGKSNGTSMSLYDQHFLDEYVRMYGEDANFKSWSDNSAAASFQNFSVPHRSGTSYGTTSSQTGVGLTEFSDCRVELSWHRNAAASHPSSNNDVFMQQNHSLVSSSKQESKNCSIEQNTSTTSAAGKVSDTGFNSVPITGKGYFDYQSLSAGQLASILPYLQPITYQHPSDGRSECRGSELKINQERCELASEKAVPEPDSHSQKSDKDAEEKQPSLPSSIVSGSTSSGVKGAVVQNSTESHTSDTSLASQSVLVTNSGIPSNSAHGHTSRSHMQSDTTPQTITSVVSGTSTQLNVTSDNSDPVSEINLGHSATSVQKFQKSSCLPHQHLKKPVIRNDNQTAVVHECSCLLCGIAIEASSHCLIDSLVTVPSKISVSEKLNLIIGFPLPRDLLPSLYVCPKCFHLVNEVDVLEHRLNICRREVLFAIEQILERNGIHVSPYKRYPRQQCVVPYQHYEVQFPPYQQSNSGNSCFHMNAQNDGQNYHMLNQGYSTHIQNGQNHLVEHSLHAQPQNCGSLTDGQQNTLQSHSNDHHLEETFHHQSHDYHVQLYHHYRSQDVPDSHLHHTQLVHAENQKESQLSNVVKKSHHLPAENSKYNEINDNFSYSTNQATGHLSDQSSVMNQRHLVQNQPVVQHQENTTTLPSCQVISHPHMMESSGASQNQLPKEQYDQSRTLQNLSHHGHQVEVDLPKSLSTTQTLPSLHAEQCVNHLENEALLGTALQNKNIELKCEGISNKPVTTDITTENHVPLLLPETSDQLMPHILLSPYQQQEQRDYHSDIVIMNRPITEQNQHISQNKDSPMKAERKTELHKNYANEVQENTDLSSNWAQHNEGLDSMTASRLHLSDCDVDIEKCDPKGDCGTEALLNTSDISSQGSVHTREDAVIGQHDPVLSSENNKDEESSDAHVAELLDSAQPPLNSPSPEEDGLDMLLSPLSPPPPPEGPPEGLRNVQDATEYHKPTLLGKNLKLTKHAKLQICRQCDQVFSNRQALIRHIERRHKSYNFGYSCDTCHRKFNSEKTVKRHLHSHKTFPCKVCGKIFLRKSKLKKHNKEHTKDSLVCKVCQKELTSVQALVSHAKMHNRAPVSFVCTVCSKIFKCKRNLDHHSRIHSGDKPYKCENCALSFRYRSNMVAHYKVCSGKLLFVCATCGRGFALKSVFQSHVAVHEGRFSHFCSICNKGFTKPYDLRYHFATHKDVCTSTSKLCSVCDTSGCNSIDRPLSRTVKRIACHVCGKVCQKYSLQDHLAQHDGRRDHQCKHCSSTFIYRSNLTYHIKTVHLQERPFTCSICHKTFTSSGSHKMHLRTHTGDKPFQCVSCGKAFTSKSNYTRHLKCHIVHADVESS